MLTLDKHLKRAQDEVDKTKGHKVGVEVEAMWEWGGCYYRQTSEEWKSSPALTHEKGPDLSNNVIAENRSSGEAYRIGNIGGSVNWGLQGGDVVQTCVLRMDDDEEKFWPTSCIYVRY